MLITKIRKKNKLFNFIFAKVFSIPLNYNSSYKKFIDNNNKNFIKNVCPCGVNKDQNFTNIDRYNQYFPTVICRNCGLIRSKYKLNDSITKDFYKNYYRRVVYNNYKKHKLFNDLFKAEEDKHKEFFQKNLKKFDNKNKKILSLGGGTGGILKHFKNSPRTLAEFDKKTLEFGKKKLKNIKSINGGIEEVIKKNIKFHLVILTHVIEHANDLNEELKKLQKICLKNKTYIYFEVPGIDSNKNGRRKYDFSGDIFLAHRYYFSSYTINEYLEVNGFKKIFINSKSQGLYLFVGSVKKSKFNRNNYHLIMDDILKADIRMVLYNIKKILKNIFLFLNILGK
jgi:ubiquinone/menaquinone biosynthesis C-methylase UbiE